MKSHQVTVHEDGTRSRWKLPGAAVDPGAAGKRVERAAAAVPSPPVHKPEPADLRRGDKVSFTDTYLRPQVGIITRINQRTAAVDCEGGSGWRVPSAMLRHVADI